MTTSSQQALARVFATRGFAWLGESSLPTATEGTPLLDEDGEQVGCLVPPKDVENTEFSMLDDIVALSTTERSRTFEDLDQAEVALITALLTTVDEEQEKWLIEADARIDSNHSSTLEAADLPGLSRRERAEVSVRVARSVAAGEVDFGPEIRTLLDRILELRRRSFSDSLRLVVTLVAAHGQRIDFSTAVLCGALGLDKAIDRFEPERGLQFSTYATWWIRQSIQRSTLDFAEGLRIPVHAAEQAQRFWRVKHELWTQTGTCPDDDEVLEQANLKYDLEKLGSYRRQAHPVYFTRGAQPGVAEVIFDGDIPSTIEGNPAAGWVEVAIERVQARVNDYERARTSNGRWHEIFVRRIMQTRTDQSTLREIGEEFGVSRERIRQLEADLLSYLRRRLGPQTGDGGPWNWRVPDE